MFLSPEIKADLDLIRSCVSQSHTIAKEEKNLSGFRYLDDHFRHDLSAMRSVKVAAEINRYVTQGRLLDWGCGYGQISYFLKKWNPHLEIYPYDIVDIPCWRVLLNDSGIRYYRGNDPIKIPFPDSYFNYIINVGTLEHVEDEKASIREIYRVLEKGGLFFSFLIPNKLSYTEYIQKRLNPSYVHPRKYSMEEIKNILRTNGFNVLICEYDYMLPYMLCGMPKIVKDIFDFSGNLIISADKWLVKIPILKTLSSNLKIIGEK